MPYLKPLPTITAQNKPFWDGLKRHEFLVPKCKDCGDYNWSPYPACRTCLSENLEWTKISGEGRLWTFTTVYRGSPAFMADGTWNIVYVEMKEKPRPMLVMSNLINVNPEDIKIGMPVKIVYEDIPDEDITLWKFEPA